MNWKTMLCVALNLFFFLCICLVGIPLIVLFVAINEVFCGIRRKVGQRTSIQQLSSVGAESHKEVTFMAIEPIQEVPGAPPDLPEPDQFEVFFRELDTHAATNFVVFTREEARRLYDLLNPPVQKKVGGSEASE